ncbi:alpha/beta-hydrolase [Zopfia rhizophila CBS 207.26]|uniref:Carboxylic ester hydrolase n=1 Tax=Zopfia rhizophila CBS 207.26 TaxID=1314779 RepID=A0A6A6DFP3_9PEZI|nr:alpha/beta-hydrolase [Zopfia rhizophila CBS 207.26]
MRFSYLLSLVVCLGSIVFGSRTTLKRSVNGTSPTIDLGYAKYEGVALDAGVNQFLGMRYAAKPTENLRWRAPEDPDRQEETQDASSFGAICLGTSQNAGSTVNEDCLFINVFTPSNATAESKLPVWFYIQGGGYAMNSNANYNGTDVVVKSDYGLVLVNFNYRVGALGFLASEKVRQNGELNVGLLDQRKGLHWVQKYIHLFGGDPNHVVIHGASAGGGSVAFHLTAYGARNDGLFVGAVPESPFFPQHRTVADSELQFDRFVNDTGCAEAADAMGCLRSKDIDTIQAANVPSPSLRTSEYSLWYFLPCIDDDFSRDHLYSLFQQGKFVKVPVMVAGDTDEGSFFAPNASSPAEVSTFLRTYYPKLTDSDLEAINNVYPLMPPLPLHAAYFPSASAAYGDATFTCGGLLLSESVAHYVSPNEIWNYRYNVQEPASVAAGLGVPHTSETPAIFGVGYAGGVGTSLETTNAGIVPVVMDYYISFVKTLDPNSLKNSVAPHWGSFGHGNGKRLKIETNDTRMEIIPQRLKQRCKLWWNLARTMEQ